MRLRWRHAPLANKFMSCEPATKALLMRPLRHWSKPAPARSSFRLILFFSRRHHIVALAAQYAVPAIYQWREFAQIGGLISYGASRNYAQHEAGIYVGKILKGAKPSDLPVQQAVKLELVVNLNTAKALGLTVPPTLLARDDE